MKKHRPSGLAVSLALLCLLVAGCGQPAVDASLILSPAGEAAPGSPEALCLAFVENHMMAEGGVYTTFQPIASNGELAGGREVLSESQGLLLLYYSRVGRQAAFEETLSFVQNHLDSGTLLSYRLGEKGEAFPVNAAVDDLRIIRGLLEGGQAFSRPEFTQLAQEYGRRFYQTNVQGGIVRDFYDEQYKAASEQSTLCYADLFTMELLAEEDSSWKKPRSSMEKLVREGYLGDEFPFYSLRCRIGEKIYEQGELHMAEGLLTVLHLAQVGAVREQTLDWLEQKLASGPLYGRYTPDGQPATQMESTAVYALCVLLGQETGREKLTEAALERMLTFQVTDPKSAVYGGFADPVTEQAYSFDNLTALLALAEIRRG
ncbi:hypothetical protein U6B65_06885 [Oscillospiraceae bacterium MB08-C2-2]|nr:hypothetical protein U6B65_06885 [Oscillospiraceae bacterium MB08-C2-2]